MFETFRTGGFAETIPMAHVQAWAALTNVLGGESTDGWTLAQMGHGYVPKELESEYSSGSISGVKWQAEFVRELVTSVEAEA